MPSGPRHDTRAEIEKATPVTTRAIEQQKIATAKVRRGAERKLEEAERNVQRALLRPRRKRKLEAEVALNERVIEMCDRQLTQLDDDLRPTRAAPAPDAPPPLAGMRPVRERSIEHAREIEL